MDRETWLTTNRKVIAGRLRWLKEKSDGVISVEPAGGHFAVVTKFGSQVRLLLVEQARPRTSITQSHLDLDDPLRLTSPYTQAAMLGLLWQSQPRRVYTTGLGGGRVPLVLHHYLPEAVIECAEIDAAIVATAIKFFGVRADERLRVEVRDGREWLAQRERQSQYDVVFVDAFVENGTTPYHLTTVEFFRLCQARLSDHGVVIVNLLETDPFYAAKIKTIQSVFERAYVCPVPGDNRVVFASQGPPPDKGQLVERARSLQDYHQFPFPFVERALDLVPWERQPNLDQVQVLSDDAPPEGYFQRPSFDSPFVRPEAGQPCPCGSGRTFEDCHGHPAPNAPKDASELSQPSQ